MKKHVTPSPATEGEKQAATIARLQQKVEHQAALLIRKRQASQHRLTQIERQRKLIADRWATISLQQETIVLQRQQLALQEVMFAKLHDFIGQLNQQMQSARKDAAALGQQSEG
jgi:hypothetical protein